MVNPVLRQLYADISALLGRAHSPAEADNLFVDEGAEIFRKAFGTMGIRDKATFTPAEPGKYSRTLLVGGEEDHPAILAMEWRSGAPPHRHAGRACMDIILSGELKVTSYKEERIAEDTYRLTPLSTTTAYPGDMVVVDPRRTEIHEIGLKSDMARTFHIYPVRATSGQFFERQPSGLYTQRSCVLHAHEP